MFVLYLKKCTVVACLSWKYEKKQQKNLSFICFHPFLSLKKYKLFLYCGNCVKYTEIVHWTMNLIYITPLHIISLVPFIDGKYEWEKTITKSLLY